MNPEDYLKDNPPEVQWKEALECCKHHGIDHTDVLQVMGFTKLCIGKNQGKSFKDIWNTEKDYAMYFCSNWTARGMVLDRTDPVSVNKHNFFKYCMEHIKSNITNVSNIFSYYHL